jgi:hypothetical protein
MSDDRFNIDPAPDPRAVAFLEGKGLKRSYRWSSMWQSQHAYGFTLAGVYRLDVLQAAKDLVTQAIAGGQTLDQFRAGFEDSLQSLGFAGPQISTGFEEGDREVDLSAPWRTRTIYDTNVRQAYAAADWQAIDDTSADFPALQYHHTPQEHPRLQHEAWDGLVLPVTSPFWETNFPPNGWFCKCFTAQVSVDDLASGDVQMSSDEDLADTGYSDDPRDWPTFEDPKTGRVARVPPGVDPGFGYNAGMDRRENLGALLERKVAGMDPDLARAAASDLVNLPVFSDMVSDAIGLGQQRAEAAAKARALLGGSSATRGQVSQAVDEALAHVGAFPTESWPVGVAPADVAAAADGSPTLVVANASSIGHSADIHPTSAADWRKVQLLLEQGEVRKEASGDLVLFGVFAGDEGAPATWTLVLKPVDGAWRVKTLFQSSPRRRSKIEARTDQVRAGGGTIKLVG